MNNSLYIPRLGFWKSGASVPIYGSLVLGSFQAASVSSLSTSAVNYIAVCQSGRNALSSEAGANTPVPVTGTFGGFRVKLRTAPGGGASWTFTILKNSLDTGCSVTISNSDTEGVSITDVPVAEGDYVSIMVTPSGTPSLPGMVGTSIIYSEEENSVTPIFTTTYGSNLNSGGTNYVNPTGNNGPITTSGLRSQIIPADGVIDKFYAALTAAPGAGSWALALQVNGVDTGLTASIFSGQTLVGSNTVSVPVSAGDVITYRVTASSSPNSTSIMLGMRFTADTPGMSVLLGGYNVGTVSNSSTAAYIYPIGSGDSLNSGVENRVFFFGACTLKAFYAMLQPGGAGTYTYTAYKNSVATAYSLTMPDGNLASVVADISMADGDELSMQKTASSFPTSSRVMFSYAVQMNLAS